MGLQRMSGSFCGKAKPHSLDGICKTDLTVRSLSTIPTELSLVGLKKIPKCFIKTIYVRFCSCNKTVGRLSVRRTQNRRLGSCNKCSRSRNNHVKRKFRMIAMLLRHIQQISFFFFFTCCRGLLSSQSC